MPSSVFRRSLLLLVAFRFVARLGAAIIGLFLRHLGNRAGGLDSGNRSLGDGIGRWFGFGIRFWQAFGCFGRILCFLLGFEEFSDNRLAVFVFRCAGKNFGKFDLRGRIEHFHQVLHFP